MLGDPCHATRWFVTHVASGITRCMSRDMNEMLHQTWRDTQLVAATRDACVCIIQRLMHHLVHVTCKKQVTLNGVVTRGSARDCSEMVRVPCVAHVTYILIATHCNNRTLISGSILLQHTAILAPSHCMHSVLQ